ncbi:hypothetical protein L596_015943 [Steinernema carpocapsae]|uniref:Uncharacterized protein n=1 Tax=Steinernema carpocapsae TaxID=34508 RepID=A0A4U5NHG5_STECR|nr:hypothetical protein L596_015943 [Steinernema carpocapsae]
MLSRFLSLELRFIKSFQYDDSLVASHLQVHSSRYGAAAPLQSLELDLFGFILTTHIGRSALAQVGLQLCVRGLALSRTRS